MNYDKLANELEISAKRIAELENEAGKIEIEHQKEILNIQKKHNDEINSIRTDALNQIMEYQKEYKLLLDKQMPKPETKTQSTTTSNKSIGRKTEDAATRSEPEKQADTAH